MGNMHFFIRIVINNFLENHEVELDYEGRSIWKIYFLELVKHRRNNGISRDGGIPFPLSPFCIILLKLCPFKGDKLKCITHL